VLVENVPKTYRNRLSHCVNGDSLSEWERTNFDPYEIKKMTKTACNEFSLALRAVQIVQYRTATRS